MPDEDFDLKESAVDDKGLPVIPFLPPTEEPSSIELIISVALMVCLTIAICGNASQIVSQIYAGRLDRRTPSQFFITILLLVNFLVPLSLPLIVLEKLVRVWMFGRLSCHAHYVLAATGRVLTPWGIAMLHGFVALLLSSPNRLSKIERLLSSLALFALLSLIFFYIIPEGMKAELQLIRKDEIDGEQYIMLIHTYRCLMNHTTLPIVEGMRFGFEFIVPLLSSIFLQMRIWWTIKRNSQLPISKNLLYTLLIHYSINILHYVPSTKRDFLIFVLPEDINIQQLVPFLAPTIMWYPLSQLSASISRYHSNKIDEERSRSRNGVRGSESERSHLMVTNVDV